MLSDLSSILMKQLNRMKQDLPAPFSCRYTPNIPEILHNLCITIAISTYQADKVIFISAPNKEDLVQLPRNFSKAMGIAVNDNGDMDILAEAGVDGEDGNRYVFIENTGSVSLPQFAYVDPEDNPFWDVAGGWNNVYPVDLDGDGDLDVVVYDLVYDDYGSDASFRYYRNEGSQQDPDYQEAESPMPEELQWLYSLPEFADMDNDGDLDMVVTSLYNTVVTYYENTDLSTGSRNFKSLDLTGSLALYPNPAADQCRISLQSPFEGPCTLQLFDATGKLVLSEKYSKEAGISEHSVDLSGLQTGLYLVRMYAGEALHTARLSVR